MNMDKYLYGIELYKQGEYIKKAREIAKAKGIANFTVRLNEMYYYIGLDKHIINLDTMEAIQ